MEARERLIRQLLLKQRCQLCHSVYTTEGNVILARRRDVWLVMASCAFCQQKDTFVIQFSAPIRGRRRITSYRLSNPASSNTPSGAPRTQSHPSRQAKRPISSNDVQEMREFLTRFDGDFQRLFAEVE